MLCGGRENPSGPPSIERSRSSGVFGCVCWTVSLSLVPKDNCLLSISVFLSLFVSDRTGVLSPNVRVEIEAFGGGGEEGTFASSFVDSKKLPRDEPSSETSSTFPLFLLPGDLFGGGGCVDLDFFPP